MTATTPAETEQFTTLDAWKTLASKIGKRSSILSHTVDTVVRLLEERATVARDIRRLADEFRYRADMPDDVREFAADVVKHTARLAVEPLRRDLRRWCDLCNLTGNRSAATHGTLCWSCHVEITLDQDEQNGL